MPMTPPAARPMERTSVSRNRMAWPSWLARKIICLLSVSLAPMSSSLASRLMAMMPLARGLEYSVSADFFTVPLRVARNTNLLSSSRLRAATSAVSFSSSWKRTKLDMALPRVAAAASGISYTFSQFRSEFAFVFEVARGDERGELLIFLEADQARYGFAARGRGSFGNFVHLQPVPI